MFELNLIKDKARARARRRIIFVSIMVILLLSGLVSIVVAVAGWREKNILESHTALHLKKTALYTTQTSENEAAAPKAEDRLQRLIKAYNEDKAVLTARPHYSRILAAITKYRPPYTDFWYTNLTISPSETDDAGKGEFAQSKALVGNRRMTAMGFVQKTQSDSVVSNNLSSAAEDMHREPEFFRLLGKPEFILQTNEEVNPAGGTEGEGDTRVYYPFKMTSERRRFAGPAPLSGFGTK